MYKRWRARAGKREQVEGDRFKGGDDDGVEKEKGVEKGEHGSSSSSSSSSSSVSV